MARSGGAPPFHREFEVRVAGRRKLCQLLDCCRLTATTPHRCCRGPAGWCYGQAGCGTGWGAGLSRPSVGRVLLAQPPRAHISVAQFVALVLLPPPARWTRRRRAGRQLGRRECLSASTCTGSGHDRQARCWLPWWTVPHGNGLLRMRRYGYAGGASSCSCGGIMKRMKTQATGMADTKVIFFQVSTCAWCSACESPENRRMAGLATATDRTPMVRMELNIMAMLVGSGVSCEAGHKCTTVCSGKELVAGL